MTPSTRQQMVGTGAMSGTRSTMVSKKPLVLTLAKRPEKLPRLLSTLTGVLQPIEPTMKSKKPQDLMLAKTYSMPEMLSTMLIGIRSANKPVISSNLTVLTLVKLFMPSKKVLTKSSLRFLMTRRKLLKAGSTKSLVNLASMPGYSRSQTLLPRRTSSFKIYLVTSPSSTITNKLTSMISSKR